MRWLTLHLELVTPCFLAGFENGGENEPVLDEVLRAEGLRPASLIGQWRYWLRAGLGATRSSGWADREEILFGSQHDGGRQGCVWVRPGYPPPPLKIVSAGRRFSTPRAFLFQEDEMRNPIDPLAYLLGQGLLNFKTGSTRPALDAGQVVPIQVTVRPTGELPTSKLWEGLRVALWLWQTFGGLGSRCRRGWGSVIVNRIEGCQAIDPEEQPIWKDWFPSVDGLGVVPDVRRQLFNRVSDLAGNGSTLLNETGLCVGPGTDPSAEASTGHGGEPEFSHLGSSYIHVPGTGADTWEAALARIGLAMLRARSNAPDRRREPKSLPRVWDHDNVHGMLHEGTRLEHAPFRAAFGLPHNYFFRGTRKTTIFEGDKRGGCARRASPVLVHVSRFGSQFVPVVLWLKAKLTDGDITSREHSGALRVPDWSAVVGFLRGLDAPDGGGPRRAGPPLPFARAPVAAPTQPAPPPKPLNKGQLVKAVLRLRDGQWQAEFPDHNRTGAVTNPAKVPAGTADGAGAEFYIEEANKIAVRARLERVLNQHAR